MKPTPCTISDGACIQLSTNQSWVLRGDKIVYGPVAIAHGRKGYETPLGMFSVLRKVKDDWSIPYNGPMPNAVYFTYDGVAFHQGDLNSQSHGCVRLNWEDSQVFYDNLAVGESVQVLP